MVQRYSIWCTIRNYFIFLNGTALRSAFEMEWKGRLNVEISLTGEKYRLITYKIDELLQFACIWACFDDGKRVHYVLHAYYSEKSV